MRLGKPIEGNDMKTLFAVAAIVFLGGCEFRNWPPLNTFVQPQGTSEQQMYKDMDECVKGNRNHNGMVDRGMYRTCMEAKGYVCRNSSGACAPEK